MNNSDRKNKYFNLAEAKSCFRAGENVTALLRTQTGSTKNTSEIIEIAYDLQAGPYIEAVKKT